MATLSLRIVFMGESEIAEEVAINYKPWRFLGLVVLTPKPRLDFP
jgi:hypothetical protein